MRLLVCTTLLFYAVALPSDSRVTDVVTTTEPRQDPRHPVTQPAYPQSVLDSRDEGVVVLGFTVRADGSVDGGSIRVVEGSGADALDRAAMQEARSWRFLPAMRNSVPVDADHKFRVVFQFSRQPMMVAPPLDVLRPPPTGPVCDGVPVLTPNGPRALRNIHLQGKLKAWPRIRAAADAIGIPAEPADARNSPDFLVFELTTRVPPERAVGFYNRLLSGEFGPMTFDDDGGMQVVIDSIHRLVAKGCVTTAIFQAPLPREALGDGQYPGDIPEAGVPLN